MSEKPTKASAVEPVAVEKTPETVEEVVAKQIAKSTAAARVRVKAIRAVDEDLNGPTYSSPDLFERLSKRAKGPLS
jgi:hypothetical protein